MDQASKAREPAALKGLMLIHAVTVPFLIFIPSFLAYLARELNLLFTQKWINALFLSVFDRTLFGVCVYDTGVEYRFNIKK
jgi:hypothetical protein